MIWQPGRRRDERALEAPYEDVPAHLAQPLWNWVGESLDPDSYHYGGSEPRYRDVAIQLRMPLANSHDPAGAYLERAKKDPEFMLDVAETLLEMYGWDNGRAKRLADLLSAANSAYQVRDDWSALEERVTPGVRALVAETVQSASGSAGDHLVNAWNAAYGRAADPVKAYSEAIKAVEAALAPLVSPQNGKQTLGTMIKDVQAKPAKWEFVLSSPGGPGVETVVALMKSLWNGQTSRHGGTTPTRAETPDEARAGVHVAATLVQLALSRAFDTV